MNTFGQFNSFSTRQVVSSNAAQSKLNFSATSATTAKGSEKPTELHEKFTQFVGEAFYGQMLKAMRSTVGKPAYFHGGRAEEVFQSQLDQKMSEHLTKTNAAQFADPMFARQFPQYAEAKQESSLNDLSQLRRQ